MATCISLTGVEYPSGVPLLGPRQHTGTSHSALPNRFCLIAVLPRYFVFIIIEKLSSHHISQIDAVSDDVSHIHAMRNTKMNQVSQYNSENPVKLSGSVSHSKSCSKQQRGKKHLCLDELYMLIKSHDFWTLS